MHTFKRARHLILAVLLTLFAAACGQRTDQSGAQTNAESSADDKTVESYELIPLNAEECAALASAVGQGLGLSGELSEAPIRDYVTEQEGIGCQWTFTATGESFEHIGLIEGPAIEAMINQQWQEDLNYSADGPGTALYGFLNGDRIGLLEISSGPADESLCTDDEPFGMCWDRLTPEQRRFVVTLNFAQGRSTAVSSDEMD